MNFLTDRQKQILAVLAASPAGLTIKELEERVGVSRRISIANLKICVQL
ncbi:HTH domain-containing protein [Lactobacillus amylolyticus]|uniref:Uncharacterized protein n=1 Tax=Lactobacillus amylolyticus DSM 11664 TaxID=585524 RepID=D4YU02_9LACO|nr:helix-turn-helix domain-containing protein [Lactobacillus amylolyticus]EFG55322.1 hypothetical protein HMPREF0493_1013 [Lactobacillus amylolyticus DSM 11664]QFY04540.1 HTH domain-containing protein [Lactobacillus amylolyticus]TDG64034.1 hypothetical protein C5L18_000888 [Lactobacillus amylolyticus]